LTLSIFIKGGNIFIMKYCINYSNKSHILDKVDEIIIRYDEKKLLELFTQFIPAHQEQRIIVRLLGDNIEEINTKLKKVISIHDEHKDLKFDILLNFYDNAFMEQLNNTDINYFFGNWVQDWESFIGLVNKKVSDIYITGSLGFELDKVAAIAHKNNVKIRVFPNYATSNWNEIDSIYKFFIRPEDIGLYEQYVDICEFLSRT